MTYTETRIAIAAIIYLGCCALTIVIIRDGLDRWGGRHRSPWLVALLASLPWWLGVPALLVLLGLVGPV